MKRSLKFKNKDGTTTDFEIEKFITITMSGGPIFMLEKMRSGKYRLTVNSAYDISQVESIEINRGNDE